MSKANDGKSDLKVSYTPVAPLNKDEELEKILQDMLTERLKTPEHKPMYFGSYKKEILALLNNQILEAKIGWSIELPNLPYFQIIAMDAKSHPHNGWKSPIYDTKNLPCILKDTLKDKDIL